MTPRKADIGASVTARLLNQARQKGVNYQTLLTTFCLERFLYRLGQSVVRERFVLKGAMLLKVWSHQPYRATRDLDFLRRGEGSFAAIQADVQAIRTHGRLLAEPLAAHASARVRPARGPRRS